MRYPDVYLQCRGAFWNDRAHNSSDAAAYTPPEIPDALYWYERMHMMTLLKHKLIEPGEWSTQG